MRYTLFAVLLAFIACKDTTMEHELAATKIALEEAQKSIINIESRIEAEGSLVHLVLLKVKPEVAHAKLVAEVETLKGIEEVMDLEFGAFEDLADARALSSYSFAIQMSFADTTAYQTYQKHPIHLALKENLKDYLAGPPATYDFMKE